MKIHEKLAKTAEKMFPKDEDAQVKYLTRVFDAYGWGKPKMKRQRRLLARLDKEAKLKEKNDKGKE